MSSPSNLYAEKVFSEHPLVLWALDDPADYVSMISEDQRKFSNWSVTGAVTYQDYFKTSPFPTSITNGLDARITDESFGEITCISDDIINFSDMNQELKTFSIGTYFYSQTSAISGFQLGYEYYDTSSGQTIQHLKSFNSPASKQWMFVSETFEIPEQNTTLRLVVKINYFFTDDFENTYNFTVNGISLGQWSEEFNSTSLGVVPTQIPSGIFQGTTDYGVEAVAYGLQDNSGYYLSANNTLAAKNTGIPMVYGASGITKILPNSNRPSLILPGQGFLHESGKYNDYTFEMWLRVVSDSSSPKKIFGPVNSFDGLWVDGSSLVIRVNDHIATYYVGEWGKPMLVHFVYGANGASLLINGDRVANAPFNSSELSFASSTADWVGFWSYEDVSSVEIDAVAVYSYQVAPVIAKRRFVYGQAVDFPENINTAYSGSSVFIDYQYADYTNNYVYPDIGRWNQGVLNNLSIENNALSAPDYKLPNLVLKSSPSKELEDILFSDAVQVEDTPFFSLKPSTWTEDGYLGFDSFNFLREDIKAFYAVIKPTVLPTSDEVILHIESESTSNYFSIVMNGNKIKYNLFYNGALETIYLSEGISVGERFPVGLNIKDFTEFFGKNTLAFFGNKTDLRFYIGGTKNFDKSFHGKYYTVGFCNASSLEEVKTLFNIKGCVLEYEDVFDTFTSYVDADAGQYTGTDEGFWQFYLDGGTPSDYPSFRLLDHTASYTLFVKNYFDKYYLDIAIKSSWKDYLPMTYFAENVKDSNGDTYYDLDFIQFNIDHPAPSRYLEIPSDPITWKYGVPTTVNGEVIPSLSGAYSSPVKRTYDALGNQLYTGFNDYEDLKNKSSKTYKFDTTSAYVRSYVSFEYISSGVNASDSYYTKVEGPSKSGVVTPTGNWMKTKYEVVDNMIIYPPAEDITSIAMVTKLEFKIDGILTHNINVRSLEYASQAFNDSSANPVGTKFGTPIYPYRKSGYYYNYKDKNPFSIYKKSSPYLFLTRYSGITLRGDFSSAVNRGLSIPVNPSLSQNYKVMAFQSAVRFDQDFFSFSPTPIFEVESRDQHLKFFMVANSPDGKRAKIYAINVKTGQLENGIAFFWNGKIVKEPVLTVKEWGFLGLSFSKLLDFRGVVGAIRLTGPLTFNVISYYQSTTLQEVQQVTTRKWFRVKYSGEDTLNWKFWTPAYTWDGVLIIATKSYYGVDPETIYQSYTGTNKIIVDSGDEFALGKYEYNYFKDASWQQNTIIPV